MLPISISNLVQSKCPTLQLGCIACHLKVEEDYPELLKLIESELSILQNQIEVSNISKIPTIQSSRVGYKALGKDPARYRLSAEALLRRVVKGKGLYQVNNVVDLLNLISVKSGYSIGGYDAEKITGAIELKVGEANEPYAAIGRGSLNIEFLPTLKDELSSFGSPTSDSTRTMVNKETGKFMMVFFNFGGHDDLQAVMDNAIVLLGKYASATNFETKII